MTDRSALPVVRGSADLAEAAAAAGLDVATIDAVTRLLGQLERTTRASRPIVLHSPAAVVPSPAPGHPGINVTIPGPPEPIEPEPAEDLPRLFTRAEVSFFAAMATIATGGLAFVLDHVALDLSGFAPVVGGFWLLFSAAAINRWAARHGGIEVVHGRVKPRGRT